MLVTSIAPLQDALYGTAALLVLVYAIRFLPEAVQAVDAGLAQAPRSLEEVSRTLGLTRARAVVGYTKSVDFLESAAFELLLIDSLSTFDDSPSRAKKQLVNTYPNLTQRLGLKFIHATRTKTT